MGRVMLALLQYSFCFLSFFSFVAVKDSIKNVRYTYRCGFYIGVNLAKPKLCFVIVLK